MKNEQKLTLSVIIITKNKGNVRSDFINSTSYADKIIVVETKCSKKTSAINKKLGAKVKVTKKWHGSGHQKNLALSLKYNELVLSVCGDEIVTTQLKQEIQQVLQSSKKIRPFKYLSHQAIADSSLKLAAGHQTLL